MKKNKRLSLNYLLFREFFITFWQLNLTFIILILLFLICRKIYPSSDLESQNDAPVIQIDFNDPGLLKIDKNGYDVSVYSQSYRSIEKLVYSQSQIGTLTEVTNEVIVEYVGGVLPEKTKLNKIFLKSNADEITPVFGNRHRIRVKTSAKQAIDTLQKFPEVRYAYPVLFNLAGLKRLMLTDSIVICLNNDNVSIDEINKRYGTETVRQLFLTSNQFVIRLINPKERFPLDVVKEVASDPDVEWAEPDFIREWELHFEPNDPLFSNQWHLHSVGQNIGGKTPVVDNDVDAPEAWGISKGNPNIVISIVDSGVETTHEDLAANIHPNGYDFYDDDNDPNPTYTNDNHGTACAGVAAAVGNNSTGVAGIAYNCKILPVKIAGDNHFVIDSVIADAIRYAGQYADVISCSWGGAGFSSTIQSAIHYVRQWGAGGKGSIVLASAGNWGGFLGIEIQNFPEGTFTFRWKYVKNGSISEGDDTFWLDSVKFSDGKEEYFDSVTPPNLPSGWKAGGNTPWETKYADSVHPAHSGNIFAKSGFISHYENSYIEYTKELKSKGVMSFYIRVNSESPLSLYDLKDYAAFQVITTDYNETFPMYGGTVAYPSELDSTVCVGASDYNGIKSVYSQYGPELDFVAPSNKFINIIIPIIIVESETGEELRIETTDRTGSSGYANGNYCKAGDNTGFGGTSSAAPLAAGIAALVRSIDPELSPTQIRNIMRETADKIDSDNVTYIGRQTGHSIYYGYGRVNAYGVVKSAQSQPNILELGNDLKITEVADDPLELEFVEIYNKSSTKSYSLDNLAITNNEAGNDTFEGSCRFPEGYSIPPEGMVVVVLGTNISQAFIDEITVNAMSMNAPKRGVKIFETKDSGLSFNGSQIPEMELLGSNGPRLDDSDNVMLVVTDGYEITFLSEVIDGLVYGNPILSTDNYYGVHPRKAEASTFASNNGLYEGYSLQREKALDTDDSIRDFFVEARNPGALTPPLRDSECIFYYIPDEIPLRGERLLIITFKNTGRATWTQTNSYKLGFKGDNPPSGWPGRVELPHDVAPGEEVTFNFWICPEVEGEFIITYQMLQEGVIWFGVSIPKTIRVVKYTEVDENIFELFE